MAVWAGAPRPWAFLVSHSKNRFPQPWRHWLRYAFPGKWRLPSREAFAENGNWRCLPAARTGIDVLFVFRSGPPWIVETASASQRLLYARTLIETIDGIALPAPAEYQLRKAGIAWKHQFSARVAGAHAVALQWQEIPMPALSALQVDRPWRRAWRIFQGAKWCEWARRIQELVVLP
jgi:hypothetical protein